MNPTSATVLIVEDEAPIRRFLRPALQGQGYHVIEAATLRDGLVQASTRTPELIIVDLGLPDGDGLELIRRIREWSAVPIVVLSAREREGDKVLALDEGADDYLTKPFGVSELLARLRVALRHHARLGEGPQDASLFVVGSLSVDLARRSVTVDSRPVALTPIEFKLLSALVRAPGRVFTHHSLLEKVWGPHRKEPHLVRVHLANLRRKLERDPTRPRYLLTEPGVGYRLADE